MEKKAAEPSKEVARPAGLPPFRDLLPWHWGPRGAAASDPFESLQESMNRLFESFRREIGKPAGNGDLGIVRSKMDVAETDDAFELRVELPGMDEKNVDVSVTADALKIRGEKKSETSEKKKDYHHRECSFGSIERVVPLPDGVDTDKAAAKFRNGVLTVTLPKTADARRKARKIEIQS